MLSTRKINIIIVENEWKSLCVSDSGVWQLKWVIFGVQNEHVCTEIWYIILYRVNLIKFKHSLWITITFCILFGFISSWSSNKETRQTLYFFNSLFAKLTTISSFSEFFNRWRFVAQNYQSRKTEKKIYKSQNLLAVNKKKYPKWILEIDIDFQIDFY